MDPNKIWTINFSKAIDVKQIQERNVFVTDTDGEIVPVLYYVDNAKNNQLQIIPIKQYASGQYTLWVRDIKSVRGEVLKSFAKLSFTVK